VFGYVLTTVITLLHVYVFGRAVSIPFLKRHVSRKLLIGSGIVLWGVFVIGRVFGHGNTGTIARMLEFLGMNWMGILFLLFVCLLAVDLATGFGFFLRRRAPSLRGVALLAGGVLAAIALVQGMRPPVVQNFEVFLPGLPPEMDDTTLVAISDLHVGSLLGKECFEARIADVLAQHPDLIVLLGDIFEGHGESHEELLPVLRHLSAPLGVWAVTGNHESHGRNHTTIFLMQAAGIHLLRNCWAEIRPGFVLAGVDDLTTWRRSGENGDPLSKALAGRPPGATVLLSHTPWEADKAAKAGVNVMLSGHTHGGQIWPFGYLVKRVYPLLEGRYEVEGMTVIVSRGAGTWGPRMRLWRPGDILCVKLRGEKEERG